MQMYANMKGWVIKSYRVIYINTYLHICKYKENVIYLYMQKYIKDIFDEKCIYIYANVYHFVAYMNKLIPSRGPGEGGVGSEKISKFSFQVHI